MYCIGAHRTDVYLTCVGAIIPYAHLAQRHLHQLQVRQGLGLYHQLQVRQACIPTGYARTRLEKMAWQHGEMSVACPRAISPNTRLVPPNSSAPSHSTTGHERKGQFQCALSSTLMHGLWCNKGDGQSLPATRKPRALNMISESRGQAYEREPLTGAQDPS